MRNLHKFDDSVMPPLKALQQARDQPNSLTDQQYPYDTCYWDTDSYQCSHFPRQGESYDHIWTTTDVNSITKAWCSKTSYEDYSALPKLCYMVNAHLWCVPFWTAKVNNQCIHIQWIMGWSQPFGRVMDHQKLQKLNEGTSIFGSQQL